MMGPNHKKRFFTNKWWNNVQNIEIVEIKIVN